eukprot:scaffold13397_cov12-Tisochrysis_lutea.AAC.1
MNASCKRAPQTHAPWHQRKGGCICLAGCLCCSAAAPSGRPQSLLSGSCCCACWRGAAPCALPAGRWCPGTWPRCAPSEGQAPPAA